MNRERTTTGTRITRRGLLGRTGWGLGSLAAAYLLCNPRGARAKASLPLFPPTAKRVIFLYQSGGPSQVDLFDAKPELTRRHGDPLPASVRMGQRLTTMTANQESLPLMGSPFPFAQHGQCGAELSELLPHTAKVVDDLCIVRSLYTDAINHDPAITFMQTGSQRPGRPSMGAWVSYALGNPSEDLPAFVVMLSGGAPGDQPLFGRLWGSGFLPTEHQGVKFRGGRDPVLYLSNPPGIDASMRRSMLDGLARLNRRRYEQNGEQRVLARMKQFEIAGQMQAAVPRLTDLSDESPHTFELYGPSAKKPGTYAANCLLARRLVERGVRFVQLYHRGWDHHKHLEPRIETRCQETDQPSAALIVDLKQRGLLDDTLVVWAGEFGRTAFCQGEIDQDNYGRDHHPRCFSIWLSGGGIKAGATIGQTDAFSYNITESPIHVHDLQATILRCLGLDHEQLTYRFEGRDHRLTDIGGRVVTKLLA